MLLHFILRTTWWIKPLWIKEPRSKMHGNIVLRFWLVELRFFQKTDEILSVIPMKHVLDFRGFSSLIALRIKFSVKIKWLLSSQCFLNSCHLLPFYMFLLRNRKSINKTIISVLINGCFLIFMFLFIIYVTQFLCIKINFNCFLVSRSSLFEPLNVLNIPWNILWQKKYMQCLLFV